MLQSTFDILSVVFTQLWRLFTSWHIPGTVVTPAAFLLAILFAAVFLRIFAEFVKGK